MLQDLLHRDLTGFSVRKFPKTPALIDQRVQSLVGPEAWWYDVLALGHPVEGGSDEWAPWKSTTALYDDYLTHARRKRYGAEPIGEAAFGKCLTKWGTARRQDGKRGYHFGTLAEARAAFCRATGLPDEWELD